MGTPVIGRHDVVEAWRQLLLRALADDVRELWWSDVDFADWPLNEPALIEALTRWARPHHRLHLLAQHYDEVAKRHPRFVRWRRDWGHLVDAWCVTDLPLAEHPGLCIAANHSIELLDRWHWRAIASQDPADTQGMHARLDVILQRSTPGFPATTLGL